MPDLMFGNGPATGLLGALYPALGIQNSSVVYTISGSTQANFAMNTWRSVAIAEPPAPADPAEIAWLKRRVREIEWRP